jgi:hypothetical protein
MRWSLLLILLVTLPAYGQKLLKGMVVDEEKSLPVPGASIFLNNTSIGTTSDAQGRFELSIPQGKYELIVSSLSYATANISITSPAFPDTLTIRLKPRASTLENVVVEAYEKEGWKKWGDFFIKNFVGTSEHASGCRILNPEVIRFRHNKKTGEVTATAYEPLMIENRSLGYNIRYQLEVFRYDAKTGYLLFQGYPFFEPMGGGLAREKKWAKLREDAYYGSMLHFMRSLYRNRLVEEGFEVRHLVRIPNAEKERVRQVYANARRSGGPLISFSGFPSDSMAYYRNVMEQPNYYEQLGHQVLSGDSIAFAVDSVTAGLYFENHLAVLYRNAQAPRAYQQLITQPGPAMRSELQLLSEIPLQVQSNGSYYDPGNMVSSGYWGWWEKIATMLPFDYKPVKK